MDDSIRRQAAIDAVQSIGRLATLPDNDAVIRMSAVEYVLFNMPLAQPEIIRCQYCKYARENRGELWICAHPDNNAWRITEDFYCGRAERREE